MESWDHPTKSPAGYTSTAVFAWNTSIADDWKRLQGDMNVIIGYPFKLRYALQNVEARGSYLEKPAAILYAASSSSLSGKTRFDEELIILHEICEATERLGIDLLIKPRPNGRFGDFSDFTETYTNVVITENRSVVNSGDYFLDDEYNNHRFSILSRVQMVICMTTTFALDAAVYCVPVLQLDLRRYSRVPNTASRSENLHLTKYLLCHDQLTFCISDDESLSDELVHNYKGLLQRAELFSKAIRDWIFPRHSMDDTVKLIAAMVLDKKHTEGIGNQSSSLYSNQEASELIS